MEFNYFSWLCFSWAFVGIVTRILMIVLGYKWNKWEMDRAYTKKKPAWIYGVGGLGFALVVYTWYQVFNLEVAHSWIIAVIISLSLIKISALLFNYSKFRKFASETLNNPQKKRILNLSVFLMSIIFIMLGIYVY